MKEVTIGPVLNLKLTVVKMPKFGGEDGAGQWWGCEISWIRVDWQRLLKQNLRKEELTWSFFAVESRP